MTSFLNTCAAVTVAAVIAVTGAPPIDLSALRAFVSTRPAFIAGAR